MRIFLYSFLLTEDFVHLIIYFYLLQPYILDEGLVNIYHVLMKEDLKVLKQKINAEMQPLKEMLSHRYDPVQKKQWLQFITKVKSSVVRNPDQYIAMEILPSAEILSELLGEIFDEYIRRYISE
jgi:hypothetical protein